MPTTPPAVSTIIPTFRRPRELEEAVRSVLAQEIPLEIWVIDDSPEKSARAIVEVINDPRVNYLAMEKPTGGVPGLVRNLGLGHARGELLHFLDDDDIVPRGWYRRALARFEREPKLAALFGRVLPFGTDEAALAHEHHYFEKAARRARLCAKAGGFALASMQSFVQTMLVCSAGLFRRAAVVEVGGFDAEVRLVEDVDLYARIFQRYPAAFVDEATVHYRIGPSLMHSRHTGDPIGRSYIHMHARYRRELGRARFLALKLFARTVLRAA